MTKKDYIYIGAIVVLLIGGFLWRRAEIDRAEYEQINQDMKPVHQEAARQKEIVQKDEAANQEALRTALTEIKALKQRRIEKVDYAAIDAIIQARMGVKSETKSDSQHPDAPSTTLPTRNLRDYMLDCDAIGESLKSCRKSVDNKQSELDAEKKDHEATKAELKKAEKAVNGGFWHQAKNCGVKVGLGVGVGAAFGGQKGAIGGGLAGAGACLVRF